jgi:serine protease DegQ
MKRTWLLFAQAVTVLLAAYFVVATLKPEWLNKRATSLGGVVSIVEAPAGAPPWPTPGSLSVPAKKASQAVVSINTSKAASAIRAATTRGSASSSATRATSPRWAWAAA